MDFFSRYIQYFSELCEGTRTAPSGITLTEAAPEARAEQLAGQVEKLGIDAFVRLCAAQDGICLPQDALDAASDSRHLQPEPLAEPEAPVQSEIRDIYEVFLDSVCLDDRLVEYLIEVLKRRDMDGFAALSRAAARTLLDMDDFLSWLANKQLLGSVDEQACVRIMDGVFDRLCAEGQKELLAALLSGDEAVFCRFRADAPELCHLPDATYAWYSQFYLDGYYPVRYLMKANGVSFPEG